MTHRDCLEFEDEDPEITRLLDRVGVLELEIVHLRANMFASQKQVRQADEDLKEANKSLKILSRRASERIKKIRDLVAEVVKARMERDKALTNASYHKGHEVSQGNCVTCYLLSKDLNEPGVEWKRTKDGSGCDCNAKHGCFGVTHEIGCSYWKIR